MKIAIIGAGNLGKSIAKGILNSNGATHMFLTKRNTRSIKDYESYGNVTVTSDNKKAVKKSDVLIFALQPSQMKAVLEEIKKELTDKHVIISTAAGLEIEQIEQLIGSDKYILRAMPNTAISVGES